MPIFLKIFTTFYINMQANLIATVAKKNISDVIYIYYIIKKKKKILAIFSSGKVILTNTV